MSGYASADNTCLTPPYDDVLDVLKALLVPIPVDGDWYKSEYPAVAEYLRHAPGETPNSHFSKHGYFEGRKPFAAGWQGLTELVPFSRLKTRLRVTPGHGRLRVCIERSDFLEIIKSLLVAAPIDVAWYRATYPAAAKSIDDGTFSSAADHYAQAGYFDGHLTQEMRVDTEWYLSRYEHVRTGLKRGHAKSAHDHFMRLGYQEGCRPTPP